MSVKNACIYFLGTFLLFCHSWMQAGTEADSRQLQYDTLRLPPRQPALDQEKEVFASHDLNYVREKSKDDNLLERILDKLFGSVEKGTKASTREFYYKAIFWFFVMAGLGLIVWVLLRSEFSGAFRKKGLSSNFNFSDIEEPLHSINFGERIRAAIAAADYRMAVRLDYLQQLNALHEKGWIQWESFKTNFDYTNELKDKTLREEFTDISRVYDYVWYGQMELDNQRYTGFEKLFRRFEQAMTRV